jgi:hypothetical protein
VTRLSEGEEQTAMSHSVFEQRRSEDLICSHGHFSSVCSQQSDLQMPFRDTL